MRGRPEPSAMELVRDTWRGRVQGRFRRELAVLASTTGSWRTRPPKTVDVSAKKRLAEAAQAIKAPPASQALEIVFRPDPTVWDGRFSNNGWLQELPKPITKLTWDNAAMVSPSDGQTPGPEERAGRRAFARTAARVTAAGLDQSGAGRRRGLALARLRPDQSRQGGRRDRASTPMPCGVRRPMVCRRPWAEGDIRLVSARHHAALPEHGGTRPVRVATLATSPRSRISPRRPRRSRRPASTLYPQYAIRRLQVGHGDQPEYVHRLQRLRDRLPGREQYPRRRQGSGRSPAATCTGSASTATTRARTRTPPTRSITSPCPACTARTPRASWSARSTPPCTTPRG